MNVHLGPVFDQFVARLIKSGHYQTQSEVVREGLRLLKEREELKQLQVANLRQQIALGIEQADRSELVDGPQLFANLRRPAKRAKPKPRS